MFIEEISEGTSSKADFVHNLGVLLSQTREDIEGCTLLDNDTAVIRYTHGYEIKVNIHMDSWLSIILDVSRSIEM